MKLKITYHSGGKEGAPSELEMQPAVPVKLGRDPACAIAFDVSSVSREHAQIEIDPSDARYLVIRDLGSTNKTFLNGSEITETVRLNVNDRVKLGRSGPEIQVDMDPRPPAATVVDRTAADLPATNAEVPLAATGAEIRTPTSTPAPTPATSMSSRSEPRGVGRETFEATVRDLEGRNRRSLGVVGGAFGVIVLGLIGYMIYKGRTGGEVAVNPGTNPTVKTEDTGPKPPNAEELAKEYGDSVAIIDVSWELEDATTRQPLYQRVFAYRGVLYRVYSKNKKGRMVPLLTSISAAGVPITGRVRGTGFVIEGGRILTNRHVMQPWKNYQGNQNQPSLELRNGEYYRIDAPDGWIPALEDGVTGDQTRVEVFVGKDATTPLRANFAKASDTHDVAYLTADVGQVKPLPLADAEEKAAPQGSPIVVMGFPTISATRFDTKVDRGADSFKVFRELPSFSVGTGIIQGIKKPNKMGAADEKTSDAGDTYQMSNISISRGGSGSPVFGYGDQVIAIFAMAKSDSATTVTFAVPIKYALELLGNN